MTSVSPAPGDFEAFPKIPRLNRSCVVTEKIDGANAAIVFEDDYPFTDAQTGQRNYGPIVFTQSRKRLLRPGKDTDLNGFAAWVLEHRDELYALLGPGRHYGEWYGQGIQRSYGLDHRRFALFNVARWQDSFEQVETSSHATVTKPLFLGEHAIHTVPWLRSMDFSTGMINALVRELAIRGSQVPELPGRAEAEGVVVYHQAARQMFKVTVEGDERPKNSQEPA
jgi:hypothetical protein